MGNGAGAMRVAREVALGEREAPRELATLFEQAARLIHASGHSQGLVPAQWTALRYFARAGAGVRTVAGLMRFQNMALSPVARTVRLLVEKGLLERLPNPRDRRADLIEVTPAGRRMLEADPTRGLEQALAALPIDQSVLLSNVLKKTIRGMLVARDFADADGDELLEAQADINGL